MSGKKAGSASQPEIELLKVDGRIPQLCCCTILVLILLRTVCT